MTPEETKARRIIDIVHRARYAEDAVPFCLAAVMKELGGADGIYSPDEEPK